LDEPEVAGQKTLGAQNVLATPIIRVSLSLLDNNYKICLLYVLKPST